MKRKTTCYTELAYVLGILALALGTALMERGDFGMSIVVAPAYLIHLYVSRFLPFYSFGMSEYVLQAVLILVLSLVTRRFRKGYLFSFATAVIYGLTLDLCIRLVGLLPGYGLPGRLGCYIGGFLICAVGVALLFRTYIAPEAYELFVKEIAGKYQKPLGRVKTVYDCTSCLVAVALSFAFFGLGRFEGVKLGTFLCAALNGWTIGRMGALLDRLFTFRDGLPLRRLFEQ